MVELSKDFVDLFTGLYGGTPPPRFKDGTLLQDDGKPYKDLPTTPAAGYHLTPIPRGEPGELSKIEEELAEVKDAMAQGSHIMALVELSDLYGAIELYLAKYFPDSTMEDLRIMSHITKRAFKNGHRSRK